MAKEQKRPTRKGQGTEHTREALISAAKKLFARNGFDGTSVKELAEEAGVNVSLVSYHFGGKESLYRACIEEFAQAKLGAASRILVTPSSREEFKVRLRMFVEEMIRSCQTEPEVTKIIDRDIHLGMPICETVFCGTFLKLYETCVDYFRSAQKNGIVIKEADPMISAGLLFGSVMHLHRMEAVSEKFFGESLAHPDYRKRAVDHIERIFVDSLSVERAR